MPWRVLVSALVAALDVVLVLVAFAVVDRPGRPPLAAGDFWWWLLSASLWLTLALSLALSAWGIVARLWPLLLIATGLSGFFSAFALPSVGLLVFLLPLLQLVAAVGLWQRAEGSAWVLLLAVALAGWAALVLPGLRSSWFALPPGGSSPGGSATPIVAPAPTRVAR